MSIELLVQILGGLTGIAVAYAIHRIAERPSMCNRPIQPHPMQVA